MSVTLDAAALIDDLSTGDYVVTRRAAAVYDSHGRAIAGATSPITIRAAVVPASGRDLLRLPEGRRSMETRTIFTATQLTTGAQGAANEADLIAIDGRTWEVQLVESWPGLPGYYRAIAQAVA